MIVFVSYPKEPEKDARAFEDVVRVLRSATLSVITNHDLNKGDFDGSSFKDIDAVIIDGSGSAPDSGYVLAIALANKKPVLYLPRKGSLIDPSIEALTHNGEIKRLLKIHYVTLDTIQLKVKAFLQYLDKSEGRELHTIKYTLRLSPRIDRYLSWRSSKTKKNKADYLRDTLIAAMDADADYKKRLD